MWKLNTSNPGKFKEFKYLFGRHGSLLEVSHVDLEEIDADPLQVIAHKASQLGENVIVDDTSLDIEGAAVGINIRWLLEHMSEYNGRRACWTTLLGVHQGHQIFIYKGTQEGAIVSPKGTGFGFDSIFLPDGATKTLAEAKPDHVNARAKAVQALLEGNFYAIHPLIKKWDGPWQNQN